ncbi:MAG TPA: 3,4-dihydroxy-2-butanone-4-phosphate synthase [Acidobacteriota bacterium]|nr:3,4-dihydroxy-2-butanone-4-phosphate synthase [Acidobacteriota bacterium]
MSLNRVEEAARDVAEGKIVVLIDEASGSHEGALMMAAEKVTPQAVNFMAAQARGLVCLPMTAQRLDQLRIPLMAPKNRAAHATAFCVSIEARRDVTTGISAADRATTILTAIDPNRGPDDVVMPGHVFPQRARPGGVLERAGKTEAAVDLSRIAECLPAAVICQMLNADGTLAGLDEVNEFAQREGLKTVSISDLITFRLATERFVERVASMPFQGELGSFQVHLYENRLDRRRHLAFVKGRIEADQPTLVRVHTESVLSDVFLNNRSSAGRDLRGAMSRIEEEGCGVLVYLSPQDRDEALAEEFEHDSRPDPAGRRHPRGTFREYGVGAQILADLGLRKVRLLTNHPKNIVALQGFDLQIEDQIPIRNPLPATPDDD